MLHWFVPYPVLDRIPYILFTGVPVLALALASRRKDWQRFGGRLAGPAALPALVFAVFYLAFLVFTANSVDTRDALYDRYHVVILVPVLVLIFAALQDLVILRLQPRPSLARLLVLVGFAAWMVYPVHNLVKSTNLSRLEGVVTYNRYNTRALRQSQVVRILQEIDDHDGRAIYSNYPAAAWFYTRRSVYESPRGAIVGDFIVKDLLEAYRGWPREEPGYLVWFLPNEYDHVLEPRDLKRLAELQPVYRGEDGEVYRVRAR
jgi:hypothetical protein